MDNVEIENPDDIVNAGMEVAVVPANNVNDELCPDDVYHKVENIGTAFRCLQCRLLFLPMSHLDGNNIVNYETCRMHIGVLKCENCAIVLVGLAKIGCHRQVCHRSA